MGVQQQKPASTTSAGGAGSDWSVSGLMESAVATGKEMVSTVWDQMGFGNSEAAQEVANTEDEEKGIVDSLGDWLFGEDEEQSPEKSSAQQGAGTAASTQEASPEAAKSHWEQAVDAYNGGDIGLAVAEYRQMTPQAQAKFRSQRADIVAAMSAQDPELGAELAAQEASDIDRQLANTLTNTIGYADFMADEAWKTFMADRGEAWLTKAAMGTPVKFPLSEFNRAQGDVSLDGALNGAGVVSLVNTGGPLAAPDSEKEVHVEMDLTAFFTAKLSGHEKSSVLKFKKTLIVWKDMNGMSAPSSEAGRDWK